MAGTATSGNAGYIPHCQQIIKLTFKSKADDSQLNVPSVSPQASDLINLEVTLTVVCRLR